MCDRLVAQPDLTALGIDLGDFFGNEVSGQGSPMTAACEPWN
jgi:hypothetical protein